MPYIINSKSSLPTLDDLMKPLAYLRDREDRFEQQWAESDAKASMYKHYVDNIRQKNPDHQIVKQFDTIQNELDDISNNLVGSALDPNFNRRLAKVNSQYNQFAVPMEEATNRYRKYNEIAATKGPDFIYQKGHNPNEVGIDNFFDDPTLIAPKGLEGTKLAEFAGNTFLPIAQGFSKYNIKGRDSLMEIITESGFSKPIMDQINVAITTGDINGINNLNIPEATKGMLIYGIQNIKNQLTQLGVTPDDPEYYNAAMQWINSGIITSASTQYKSDIQNNPNHRPPREITLEERIYNDAIKAKIYERVTKYNSTIKDGEGTKKIGIDKNGYPIFPDDITKANFWNDNSDILPQKTQDKKTAAEIKAENFTLVANNTNSPYTKEYKIYGNNKKVFTFTKYDTFYNKDATNDDVYKAQNEILNTFTNNKNSGVFGVPIINNGKETGVAIVIPPNDDKYSYQNKGVWIAHNSERNGMQVDFSYAATTEDQEKNSHNFIPQRDVYQTDGTIIAKKGSGIVFSSDSTVINSYNLNELFVIDDNEDLPPGLPPLTKEEENTMQYVAVPRNTGSTKMDKPTEFAIVKIKKVLHNKER